MSDTEADLAGLRAVAEAATPGPWEVEDFKRNGQAPLVVGSGMAVAETFDKPHLSDAEHIATFDPPTVLGLLDRLEAAEAKVARCRELSDEWAAWPDSRAWVSNCRDELLEALEGGPQERIDAAVRAALADPGDERGQG